MCNSYAASIDHHDAVRPTTAVSVVSVSEWSISEEYFCQFEHTVVGDLSGLGNLFTFSQLRFRYRRAFGEVISSPVFLTIGPRGPRSGYSGERDRFEVEVGTVLQWEFWVLCSGTFEVSGVAFPAHGMWRGLGIGDLRSVGFGVYKNAVAVMWWEWGVNVLGCRISNVLALCRALGWLVGGLKP